MNTLKKALFTGLIPLLLLISGLAAGPAHAQELSWHPFEEALSVAESSGKPVFVDVWAPWCGWCHKLKKDVYPELSAELGERFVLTRLNRDDHETEYQYRGRTLSSFRLCRQLNTEAVPAIVILSSEGRYLFHLSGYLTAEQLRGVLTRLPEIRS